jgi:hypothetical protein
MRKRLVGGNVTIDLPAHGTGGRAAANYTALRGTVVATDARTSVSDPS